MTVLSVKDLRVTFTTIDGEFDAVRDVSFDVEKGRILGVVGESGSGKTVTALTLMRLLPPAARASGGSVLLDGEDVLAKTDKQMRAVRGNRIGMIFQDPMTALNPVLSMGFQIDEAIRLHSKHSSKKRLRARTIELLDSVGVPDAAVRAQQYPHQWSGGMRQRAVIAIALANDPDVIVADEPTTALDATVQAQVLEVILRARDDRGCAVVLISHDLGVISDIADDVVVMYAGGVVESGTTDTLLSHGRHPYSRALMTSRPGWTDSRQRLIPIPGRPPDPVSLPGGCSFHPRCAERAGEARCETQSPALIPLETGHLVACHRMRELHDIAMPV